MLTAVAQDQRLFHISRSINKNWVCYDAVQKNGQLNMDKPVHVYWHNNSDNPGHENELSWFQRKMAFGYVVVSKGNNEVTVRLTAYKKRHIRIHQHNGRWIGELKINGIPCQLTEIQVKTKDGNPLKVLYFNLVGKSLADGKQHIEQILNK